MPASFKSMRIVIACLIVFMMADTIPAQDRGFSNEYSYRHYTRNRTYDVKHLKLNISIDYESASISGTAATVFSPINDGLEQLVLDAVEMEIAGVTLLTQLEAEARPKQATRDLAFTVENDKLIIDLDHPYNRDDQVIVEVAYQTQPKMGLYFVKPDEGYPDKPLQVWSQGEQEESRYWFPCYDFPNDQMTSEMVVTVPAGQLAISNGELVNTRENPDAGTVTYHWRENVPHVTYLVSLIAGEFTEIRDSWNDVPVLYYVQPGHADMAMRSFEKTPDMIDYFSRVIGYDYPYEKYAQTTIVDFMWGGMENISATTLTEYTLHDEVAHLDFSSDGLVAHELAHQWWGDLLTTKNWNHLWLNEAFATYFDALYVEHDKGEGEFLLELIDNRRRYLEEDKHNYRRPIVYDLYEDPSEMFDVHSYQKGSLVLHMIRYLLGDELWWQAIRHYADTHAGQTVETNDFKQAIEDATGYPMDRFFEQWLYSAGHPEYSVKWKWDNKQTAVVLDVKQVQQVDDLTPLFAMPVDIALYGEFGAVTRRIDVDQVEESFILGAPSKPARVSFDPEDWLLKELSFEKSKKELIEQLRNGGKAERLQAATWLAGKSGKTVARALGLALREDPFRGVRAEAARSLGKLRTKTARDELLTGLNDPDSRVCQAVTKALGRFRGDTGVAQALVEVFNSDQSYYVQANCLTALANTNVEDAAHTINSAFQRDSFKDIIRDSALVALTILKDPQSINTALEWAAYGQPVHVRVSAIQALGKMGAITPHRQKELGDKLMALLDDPHFKGRLAAIKALGDLGHPDAIPALQTAINEEYQFKLRSAARTAIKKIKQKNK